MGALPQFPLARVGGYRIQWFGVTDRAAKHDHLVGKKGSQMTTHLDSAERGERKSHGLDLPHLLYRVGRVVFVAALLASFFLLAQSMVEHRFFEGGRYHANGSVGQ
jgi:hypothetical protein